MSRDPLFVSSAIAWRQSPSDQRLETHPQGNDGERLFDRCRRVLAELELLQEEASGTRQAIDEHGSLLRSSVLGK